MMTASPLTDIRGVIRHNEPMAKHTSWRVGGVAKLFFQPADIDDLAQFLRQLPTAEFVYWLGLGSNLLVRDGGIEGTVICTTDALTGMQQNDGTLRVEAGANGIPECGRSHQFSNGAGWIDGARSNSNRWEPRQSVGGAFEQR